MKSEIAQLKKRIAQLEKDVEELKQRPILLPYYPQSQFPPPIPYWPTPTPTITCK
jgi:hypothetical protein